MNKRMFKLLTIVFIMLAVMGVFVACNPITPGESSIKPPSDMSTDSGFIYEDMTNMTIRAAVCISAGTTSLGGVFSPSKSGSGVLISTNGYIVTNEHVVNGLSVFRVRVLNAEGMTIEYKAIKLDKIDSSVDLAVLKITTRASDNRPITEPFHALQFEDSANVAFGTPCLMLGNPKGLGLMVSRGMVSNPDINITDNGRVIRYMSVDAPVNPGNSGGAVVNRNGKIIGIVTARYEGKDKDTYLVGFAQRAEQVAAYLNRYHELKELFV